jgi:hypothetical protein
MKVNIDIDKKYYVYVVLSRSPTMLSQAIHILKQDKYTHASLSLDKNLEHMFSFGRRWTSNPFVGSFNHENLEGGIYKACSNLPSVVIEIPVSQAQYCDIFDQVQAFLQDRHKYRYNYLGLIGNLIGKIYENGNCFFCSEFVYHVLNKCNICDFGIPRSFVRPQDLTRLNGTIIYKGNLKKYAPYVQAY